MNTIPADNHLSNPASDLGTGLGKDNGKAKSIRDDLETILNEEFSIDGSFSFNKAYPDAPNPGLQLANLGLVGLPLSARDEEAVKAESQQAVGINGTTCGPRSVDPSMVTFDNPKWLSFLTRISRDVCEALGVSYDSTCPRLELHKLLLYEPRSRALPRSEQLQEQQGGGFARVIIFLPSKFTGSSARFELPLSGFSVTHSCGVDTPYETNVLAWHADVNNEIDSITSGTRLALYFDLIHDTCSPRPGLSVNDELVFRLRRIMRTWRQDKGQSSPQKLIYLLKHRYSTAYFRRQVLKSPDVHKINMLELLGKEEGFRLGMATIECHQRGRGVASLYAPIEYSFHEADDIDTWLQATRFVDLNGESISSKLAFDEYKETIPKDMDDVILHKGKASFEKFDGIPGDRNAELMRRWDRTVLVLWPVWSNYALLYSGSEGVRHMANDIKSLESQTSTQEDMELIELALANASTSPTDVAEAVCHIACRWNSPELWLRAIKICSVTTGLATLSKADVFAAISQFGFDATRQGLECLLDSDTSNTSRITFLQKLRKWSETVSDAAPSTGQISVWTAEYMTQVLRTLKKPNREDVKLLVSISNKNGGIVYLKDQILPQVITLADADVLIDFAIVVDKNTDTANPLSRSMVMTAILTSAIAKVTFFEPGKIAPHKLDRDLSSSEKAEYLRRVKLYVRVCRKLGFSHLVNSIVDRVMDKGNLSGASQIGECVRRLQLPLITFLVKESNKSDPPQLPFAFYHLQSTTIQSYLKELSGRGARVVDRYQVDVLLDAVFANDGPRLFTSTVWPALQKLKLDITALQFLVEQIVSKRTLFESTTALQDPSSPFATIVDSLATRAISQLPVDSVPRILAALDWCLKIGSPELFQTVAQRLVCPEVMTMQGFRSITTPLIQQVQAWGTQRNQNVEIVLRRIVVAWCDRVLPIGSRPAPDAVRSVRNERQALTRPTCICQWCLKISEYLLGNDVQPLNLRRIGAQTRYHVERHLQQIAPTIAKITVDPSTHPQSATVTKCDTLLAQAAQAEGRSILRGISTDEGRVAQVLGEDYARVRLAFSDILSP